MPVRPFRTLPRRLVHRLQRSWAHQNRGRRRSAAPLVAVPDHELQPGQCFVICCMGRTGSTLLDGLLNSHPLIECAGELFIPNGAYETSGCTDRREYLRRFAFQTAKPVKGFKMPYDWIQKYPGIFDDLAALNFCVISLTRPHCLDHFLSSKLAGLNRIWNSKDVYNQQTIEIDPWEFVSFVAARGAAQGFLDKAVSNFDVFPITYDELLSERTQRQLLKFLGVPQTSLTATTVRARTLPRHLSISNYAELSEFFQNTPFAHYFPTVTNTAVA